MAFRKKSAGYKGGTIENICYIRSIRRLAIGRWKGGSLGTWGRGKTLDRAVSGQGTDAWLDERRPQGITRIVGERTVSRTVRFRH
jgi:hypothetical protein